MPQPSTIRLVTAPPPPLGTDGDRPIVMPWGLLGFDDQREFMLVDDSEGPVYWLQSVQEPLLVFPVLDPSFLGEEYDFEISDADTEALKLDDPADARVLIILTFRPEPATITANLRAPIVINASNLLARQVVLDERYALRYQLYPAAQESRRPKARRKATA